MQQLSSVLLLAILIGCTDNMKSIIERHGHRGCRGLMPENSIPAFLHACELGVDYLELDVVVSQDDEIIVSHEPYFSHLFTTTPDGLPLDENSGKKTNIRTLSLDSIQSYDVGKRINSKYPDQQSVPCVKPTLDQVVEAVNDYCSEHNIPIPGYNIEVKFDEKEQDYFPLREQYADIFIAKITTLGIGDRIIIQCFDPPLLNAMHVINPKLKYGLLIDNLVSPQQNLDLLNFKPFGYMPYFKLVDKHTVELCRDQKLHLVVWTVNTKEDIQKMKLIGVDGIISDYPDRLIDLL